MHVSGKLVEEFQEKYEQKFGQEISAKEAELNITKMAELIRIIARKRDDNE